MKVVHFLLMLFLGAEGFLQGSERTAGRPRVSWGIHVFQSREGKALEEKEKSFQNFRKMQQAHAERAKARRAAQAPEARDQDAEPEKPPIREPLPRELHEAEAEEGEAGESRAADAVLAAARVFAPPPRKVDKPLAEPAPKAVTANESSLGLYDLD